MVVSAGLGEAVVAPAGFRRAIVPPLGLGLDIVVLGLGRAIVAPLGLGRPIIMASVGFVFGGFGGFAVVDAPCPGLWHANTDLLS